MAKIMVTGANGFIGGRICSDLLKFGHHVTGISLGKESDIQHPNYRYIAADISDLHRIRTIFMENEMDILLHFAAIAHAVKGFKVSAETYKRVNYLAAKNIFKCAFEKNVRIFFAGTVDVYGAGKGNEWREDVIPHPVNEYGKSKFTAEQYLQKLYEKKKDLYLIGRLAPVYAADRLVDIYKRFYLKYPNLVFSLGTKPEYSFLALDNLSRFVCRWVNGEKTDGNIINLCDDRSIQVQEIIALEKIEGRAEYVIKIPAFIAKVAAAIARRMLFSKSKAELGLSLTKLFCPFKINNMQIKNTGCCRTGIDEIVYGNKGVR